VTSQKDYTKGQLDKLVDVVIESGAKLFVSAVGVAPRSVIEKLHAAGIYYMVIPSLLETRNDADKIQEHGWSSKGKYKSFF
jgi:NAD(P)H-dependent flavin oxidoreductase YrpB (nitropropane dioxygenase family)